MPRTSRRRSSQTGKCTPCKPCRKSHLTRYIETFDPELRNLVANDCHSTRYKVGCQSKPYCNWRKRSSRMKRSKCTIGKGRSAVEAGKEKFVTIQQERQPSKVLEKYRKQIFQSPKVQPNKQQPGLLMLADQSLLPSTSKFIPIKKGKDDYFKQVPEETVNTQTDGDKYQDLCRSQVPYLCGSKTKQTGYCRRREKDCIYQDLKKSSDNSFIYLDKDAVENDRFIYRPYSGISRHKV